mgnify:CR=1 FL=1
MQNNFFNKPLNPSLSEKNINRKEPAFFLRPSSATDERWFVPGLVTWVNTTTLTGVLNNIVRLSPFVIETSTTIDKVSVNVTAVGSASSTMRVAIYNSKNDLPNMLIWDSGAFNCASTGIKSVLFNSFILKPGLYWMAWNTNSTNNTLTLTALAPGGVYPLLGLPNTIGSALGINLTYSYSYANFEQYINNVSFTIGTTSNIMYGIRTPINN